MPTGSELIVKGTAEVRVVPDYGRIRIDVDGDGSTRDEAYEVARGPAAAVDAVLESSETLLRAVSGSALVVQPRTRWRKGESVRTGWRAARATTVEVIALEELGGLLAQLAAAGASVAGPWWEIASDNPVHAEARTAAARDARARAAAYADGLGLSVGDVAWISEPGLRRSSGHEEDWGDHDAIAVAAVGIGGRHEDEPISVAPAELTIRARVEVAFLLQSAPAAA